MELNIYVEKINLSTSDNNMTCMWNIRLKKQIIIGHYNTKKGVAKWLKCTVNIEYIIF